MSATIRPRTSNPRGFCKYYATERGCYAGNQCKFLHAEPTGGKAGSSKAAAQEAAKLTPYDQSKLCVYYAAGYCRRGENCWFKHVQQSPLSTSTIPEAEPEPCSICLEVPITYGLLVNCSHIFCIQCVRQWRAAKHDVSWSGANKACPLCRVASPAVIPSSHFYPLSKPDVPSPRDTVLANYRASCIRTPCKYFEESKKREHGVLWCPFGRDCFYKHQKDDGTPHYFEQGIIGRRGLLPRPRRNRPTGPFGRDYTNTLALLTQLIHAPLNLLREAVAIAPLGIPAVLSMLSVDFLPTPTESNENILDELGIAEAIHLSSSGIQDSIVDDMRTRMELIYRLGQSLSGDDVEDEDDDPVASAFYDMPTLEPIPPPFVLADDLPPPSQATPTPDVGDEDDEEGDGNDLPGLMEVSDSSEEEEEEDDDDDEDEWYDEDEDDVEFEMTGAAPLEYFLWTQRSHPSRSVLRRRRSDSPPPLEPIPSQAAPVNSTPPSPLEPLDIGSREPEQPPIVSPPLSPPPPPPGPYTTDGRGRPVFWSTDVRNTESGPSNRNQK